MSSHARRPFSRGSLNVSLFLALLLAGFAGLTSLTRQTGAVVAPSTERTFALAPNTESSPGTFPMTLQQKDAFVAKFGPAAYATPTPWPTATKCVTSRWSAEGNANDSNGLNPGILKNLATFGPGATGQSFSLNGNAAYVEAAINTAKMNSPVSFTWEACVYPISLASNPVVFSKEASVGNRAGLQINMNGSLCSYMNSSTCSAISASGVVAPNKFTKVTLIYDGSTQKLITYVNGSQVSSATVGVPYNNSSAFNIGWSPFGGGNTHFPGFIDEVTFSSCVVPPTASQCACVPTPTPIP